MFLNQVNISIMDLLPLFLNGPKCMVNYSTIRKKINIDVNGADLLLFPKDVQLHYKI